MSIVLIQTLLADYLEVGKKYGLKRSHLIGPYGLSHVVDRNESGAGVMFGSVSNDEDKFLMWDFPLRLKRTDLHDKPDEFFLNPLNLLEEGLELCHSFGYTLRFAERGGNYSTDRRARVIVGVNFSQEGQLEVFGNQKLPEYKSLANKCTDRKSEMDRMQRRIAIDGMVQMLAEGFKELGDAEEIYNRKPIHPQTVFLPR